ncbi:Up-regulated during septation-domain-containing protein [Ampelomyces quisqualis]|uniref:Up-regulated during septation-domain-containing protein n=1 Tax=Ampelomyces quisqualis TaxID=50730 RepID=A0A6A5Q6K1_AMPQU|nr:Up-regulated during septation-domain-containing protein [Ampelomyces quisqualis]
MNSTALRRQQTWAGDAALSPPSQYDFPSPSSIYPSGVGASSPSFFPMAYQISPRFGASAFIPPPDVFVDGRRETGAPDNGGYTPRGLTERGPDTLITDPVAMHLLVETAIADSQNFHMLTVEEVEALKQEQKTLDTRLATVRKKLESETKIRDATRSLSRLALKQETGRARGTGNKGGKDETSYGGGLEASNKKVEDFIRELLETESRMRMIDMRLLMHTAAVLQLTHKGPKKRCDNSRMSADGYRRPDSPASPDIYDIGRVNGAPGDDNFDERSFYRSPENLDTVMSVLQSGILHHSEPHESHIETINTMAKRLEEMNDKIRSLLVQANPDRAADFAPPPPTTPNSTTDPSAINHQLDFLEESIRNISSEHANVLGRPMHSLSEVQGRLEGINNQLYAVLISSSANDAEETAPPPPVTGSDSTEQLNYMEKAFYKIEQTQYALKQQVDDINPRAQNNEKSNMADQYETTLIGLWQIIQAGEDEARERKRERRRLLAEEPEAEEQMSPDEDYNANETFSLPAFSSKVQWLFSRATSLEDKQSVLMRQIKQQRELNSKSDAQKEEEFERLNEQVLSARSERKIMETELERAIGQLQQFDEQTTESEMRALQERNAGLEAQLVNVQERTVAFETELKNAKERATAYESQLQDVQQRAVAFQEQLRDIQERNQALESEMKNNQQQHATSTVQSREAEERSVSYEAQIRDAQERAMALEKKLKETQAELTKSAEKIDGIMNSMKQVTLEKEAAEARSLENTNALNAKEDEFRNLEGEIVRLTTELTFAKAELDGAYGTRAQRAADSAANPAIKKELDGLSKKNQAIMDELTALRKVQDAASQSEAEARQSERNLKAELSGMVSEYEALTRDAIQNEKDRELLESQMDKLRSDKEALERELSDEKVKWLGVRSPSTPIGAGGPDMGATSIRMLREDFRKMMRDRTAEGLKALRAEQEERRRLEALVRQLRKDGNPRSNLSKTATAQ